MDGKQITTPNSTDQKVVIALLAALTAIAVGTVLHAARNVFIPLAIASFLSYMLKPCLSYLNKKYKVPPVITTTVLIMLLICAAGLGSREFKQRLAAQKDQYVIYWNQMVELRDKIAVKYPMLSACFDLSKDLLGEEEGDPFKKIDTAKNFDWKRIGRALKPLGFRSIASAVDILSKTGLVLFFLVFILLGSSYIDVKIDKAFPDEQKRKKVTEILDAISGQISLFVSVMFGVSAVTGVLIWAGLKLIGIKFAFTWGVLAFVLNFIPNIGSIVASIPPILVAVVQPQLEAVPAALGSNAAQVLMAAIWILIVQQVMGNVITNKLLGDNMNLSPVVVLTSLLLWTWLWGIAGALLSVPIASILRIVCDNVEPLKVVSVMMGSGKAIIEKQR